MSEVTIYDVDGKTYFAIMVDDIPEIPEMDNDIRRTPNFNFQVRIRDQFGNIYWFLKKKYHRLDGPAIEGSDGTYYWFINNCAFLEEDFPQAVKEFLNRGEEI